MNSQDKALTLISPFIKIGAVAGLLSYFWLWPFCILGLFLNILIGMILGWINDRGFAAAFDPERIHHRKWFYGIRLVTFAARFIVALGFYAVLYMIMINRFDLRQLYTASLAAGWMTIIITLCGIIGPYRTVKRGLKKKRDAS